MKSNYNRLGNYIDLIDKRNRNLEVDNLIGLSIQKTFIPSISNTIGTDMSTYRIIKPYQFAYCPVTSRNGEKITIALYQGDKTAIVSQAYLVFEIINIYDLDPEYLMMWFRRPEFDRYARFMSHGSVREIFSWEDLCDVELPVPDIEKQKEIVKEYNAIVNRIELNNRLIQKLEETAQAIYKQWFVDFEFPDEEGKPYKSNGGEMVFNEELQKEIPKGWRFGVLSDIANIVMGQSPDGDTYNNERKGMIFYQGRTDFGFRFPDISTYTTAPKRQAKQGDILVSVRAPVGDLNIAIKDCCIGRGIAAIRSKINCNSFLFYAMQKLKSQFNISNDEGTVFGSINKDDLYGLKVLIGENEVENFDKLVYAIDSNIKFYSQQNKILIGVKDLLLSKLAKIEN